MYEVIDRMQLERDETKNKKVRLQIKISLPLDHFKYFYEHTTCTMEPAPVLQCQQCRTKLQIVSSSEPSAIEEYPEPSAFSSRLDESFMMLEEALSSTRTGGFVAGHGAPPTKPPPPPHQGLFFFVSHVRQQQPSQDLHACTYTAGTTPTMDESFIVLQQHRYPPPSGPPPHQSKQQQQRFSLDARMSTLARVLELASEESQIDLPLCPNCATDTRRELQSQIEELEAEIGAYAALEAKLKQEVELGAAAPMSENEFASKLKTARAVVAAEEGKLAKAEAELGAVQARYKAAKQASSRLEEVEVKYWHAFNAVMLSLYAVADYRDVLQQRVDAAERSVARLSRTNVLASVFMIWHDGPFGTISGCRLGSLSELPVEWWEINAAWGQAVLLLDTLARALGVVFTRGKLIPRGSFPQVHDGRGVAELYGPANKILCISYDRAQVGFLACLKEFSEVLQARGAVDDKDKRQPFGMKYAIQGDRVGGYSIRYGLSRDRAWTKALKYMLVNLKFCLKATLEVMDRRKTMAAMGASLLEREGPSLY